MFLGQRSGYLLDRQGSFQFWDSAWDSKVMFSSFFTNFFFLDKLIVTFIRGKNSVNYFFLKKNPEVAKLLSEHGLTFNENFSFLNNFFQQKKILKKFFYLFGKVFFFKYQGWCLICFSIYRPLNARPSDVGGLSVVDVANVFEKKKQQLDFF